MKLINGKKLLTGGTLAVSVASLAVGSVALATQPVVPKFPEVPTPSIVLPIEPKESIDKATIRKLVVEALDESKQEEDIEEIKEMADEAFNEANRASFEIRTIIKQMNTNIEIYNKGFRTLAQQLEQTFKGLEEMNKQFKDWKEGTEEAMKELKKEYKEIKKLGKKWETIKEISDIDTMQTYVTKKVEPYMREKIQLNNKITKLEEKIKSLETSLELFLEEFDALREEVTEDK